MREGALSCKACGSDERVGWSEDTESGLDLPSSMDDDAYDDFVAHELAAAPRPSVPRRTRVVALVLVLVLLAFALGIWAWL